MRILIVDDEPLISGDILRVLQRHGYQSVYSVQDASEALVQFVAVKPDVVILDINLQNKIDGIDLALHFRKHEDLVIIMSTAYSDVETINRLKGVEPDALLVKPYNTSSLPGIIELALHKKLKVNIPESNKKENVDSIISTESSFLYIKSNNVYEKILSSDVLYLEAHGSYSKLYTQDKNFTISKNLNSLLTSLSDDTFVRVHRKYVVNLQYVSKFDNSVVAINEKELPMSNSYKDDFMSRVKKI